MHTQLHSVLPTASGDLTKKASALPMGEARFEFGSLLEVEADADTPELDGNEPTFSETVGLDALLTPLSAQLEMGLVGTSQTVVSGVAVAPSDSSMMGTETTETISHKGIGVQPEVVVGDDAAVTIKSDVAIATAPPEALRIAVGVGGAISDVPKNSSVTDLALVPLAVQQSPLNAATQQQLVQAESSSLDQTQSIERALQPSKPVKQGEIQKQHTSDTSINVEALPGIAGAELGAGEEIASLTPKSEQIEAMKHETRQTLSSPVNLPSNAPSFLASVVTEAQSMAPQFADEVAEFAPAAISASTLPPVDAKQILPAATPQNLPLSIARQISEATRNASDGTTEITLNPAELGRVRMSFSPTEAGMMVVLSVERPEVLELMKRHIEDLSQEFQSAGFGMASFDFSGGGSDTPNERSGSGPHIHIPDVASEVDVPVSPNLLRTSQLDIRL
ncbi:MAG: flagellar hook-length control protein FliK [Nereida ignava]